MTSSFPDIALVTGAGRGIGCATALALGKRGVHVLCLSRTDTCKAVAAEITALGGKADALSVDLADYGTVKQKVETYLKSHSFKRIGVVAAAGMLGPRGPVWSSDLEGWDNTFKVNVLGNMAVVQAALPTIRETSYGRVVMFAGGGSAYAYPTFPAYAISKTALVREVENVGVELKDLNDFSIAILAPGAVETDMLADVRASGAEVRTVTAIEEPVGFAVEFLGAAEARRLTGKFVHVRDVWREVLAGDQPPPDAQKWTLRRVE